MSEPLTAADLAAIEAEYEEVTLSCAGIRRDLWRVIAELRQARALVGRLTVDDPIYYGGRDGNDTECWYCGAPVMKNFAGNIKIAHEADCDWFAAREALAAWKGGGDAPPQGAARSESPQPGAFFILRKSTGGRHCCQPPVLTCGRCEQIILYYVVDANSCSMYSSITPTA